MRIRTYIKEKSLLSQKIKITTARIRQGDIIVEKSKLKIPVDNQHSALVMVVYLFGALTVMTMAMGLVTTHFAWVFACKFLEGVCSMVPMGLFPGVLFL